MTAVELDIANVVDQVARTRHGTERSERARRLEEPACVELAAEQQSGEDERVLDPLVRTQSADERGRRQAGGGRCGHGRLLHRGEWYGRGSGAANLRQPALSRW